MGFGKYLIALIAATATLAGAPTAAAAAGMRAAPGMPILQDGGTTRCTLGYTARNAEGARLAITAGHCGTLGATVYDAARRPIGRYIAVQPDNMDTHTYGYAIIEIRPNVALTPSLTPAFAIQRQAHPNTGDEVCMFGTTSGMRCSTVETVTNTAGTLNGSLSTGGDSGGPVIRMRDRALVGIVIGHNTADNVTFFEPIANIAVLSAAHNVAGTRFGPVVDTSTDQ
ncbi:hypothetical protein EB74_08640 [Mycobacterium sp. SWH-M5]|nr:hypothetical protein EB74_08640 [Mycobacterium sp. SWH-M5]